MISKICGVLLFVFILSAISLLGLSSDITGLTGMWSADLTLSTSQTTPVTAFRTRLDIAALLGSMTLGSRSDFDQEAWLWQSFRAGIDIDFFSLEANVLYAPDPWVFAYANGFAKLDFSDLWLTYYLGFLGSIFEGSVWRGSVLEIGNTLGNTDIMGYFYFGATLDGILFSPQSPSYSACQSSDCVSPSWRERYYRVLPVQSGSLTFTGADIKVHSYLCHDITLTSTTRFSALGFEYQEFQTAIWAIGYVPINLDIRLRFELQSKSLTLSPKFGLGERTCYGRVLVDLLTPGPIGLIEGFSIYGLDLFTETETFGFRSLSILDTDHYSLFKTDGFSLADSIWVGPKTTSGTCGSAGEMLDEYWEVVGIAAYRGDRCCRTLSFLALSYFGDSTALFDWMGSEFRAQLQIMDGLRVRTNLVLSSSGISGWSFGISIVW